MRDWRFDQIPQSMKGLTLWKSKYTQPSANWDHDHCAACWAKFMERDWPEVLHEGYTTGPDFEKGARYEWVCEQCFNDLKTEMGWSVGEAQIIQMQRR
jgi:hypothetical protein